MTERRDDDDAQPLHDDCDAPVCIAKADVLIRCLASALTYLVRLHAINAML